MLGSSTWPLLQLQLCQVDGCVKEREGTGGDGRGTGGGQGGTGEHLETQRKDGGVRGVLVAT